MCNLGCPQTCCCAVASQITKMTLCPELHLHYALPGCMIVELYLKAVSHYNRELRTGLTALNPARLKFFPIYIAAYYLVEVCC